MSKKLSAKLEDSKDFRRASRAAQELTAIQLFLMGFSMSQFEVRREMRLGQFNHPEEINWMIPTLGEVCFKICEQINGSLSALEDASYTLAAKRKARSRK